MSKRKQNDATRKRMLAERRTEQRSRVATQRVVYSRSKYTLAGPNKNTKEDNR
mgnify:CR=1 FL=1